MSDRANIKLQPYAPAEIARLLRHLVVLDLGCKSESALCASDAVELNEKSVLVATR